MIGYFVYNLDKYSGAALQALLLANHVNDRFFIFNVNYSRYKKDILSDKITIVDLPKSFIIRAVIITFYLIKEKIPIVHLHGFIILPLIISFILKKRIILKTTLLGDDDFQTISKNVFGRLKIFIVNRIDLNIVQSESMKKINAKFLPEKKIKIVHNGVLIPKNMSGLEAKENAFMVVGLICERKKILESIQYFNHNFSKIPDSRLFVIGPKERIPNLKEFDQKYIDNCMEYVKVHNLTEKVVFTGQLEKEDLNSFYSKCKSIILFSEKEGMPNVILEAMGYNCVPIVSECGGIMKEIIENEKDGFIIKPTDVVNIESLDEIIKEGSPYQKISNHFAINKIAEKYNMLYTRIVGNLL